MFPAVSREKKDSSLFSFSLLVSSAGKEGAMAADAVGLLTDTKATFLLESRLRFKGFEPGKEFVCGCKPCCGTRLSMEEPATAEPSLTCQLFPTCFWPSFSRDRFVSDDFALLIRVGPSSELSSMSVFLEPISLSTHKTDVLQNWGREIVPPEYKATVE